MKFQISVLFSKPAELFLASQLEDKDQIKIKIFNFWPQNPFMYFVPVLEYLLLTTICDFDHNIKILECKNEYKKFSDLFLFFQPGQNSKGTDHFPSWKYFSEEQIF